MILAVVARVRIPAMNHVGVGHIVVEADRIPTFHRLGKHYVVALYFCRNPSPPWGTVETRNGTSQICAENLSNQAKAEILKLGP